MKWNFIVAIFLLIGLSSCKPRKAIDLKEAIAQNERRLFGILLSKDSPKERKLKCLINDDFKGALLAIDTIELQLNAVIKETSSLPVDGTVQGEDVKTAAVNYYTALQHLHTFDRQEISWLKMNNDKDAEKAKKAQHELLQLGYKKKTFFQQVYDTEQALDKELKSFDKANDL
ncbi:MAG TPA: hypothetical protein VN040_24295 [Pseudosphingobacterium sp.]|nr:hypothetical protein [Pseudosphingobacterium sp.]